MVVYTCIGNDGMQYVFDEFTKVLTVTPYDSSDTISSIKEGTISADDTPSGQTYYFEQMNRLIIGEGVRVISADAFKHCHLTSVTLPDSLEIIGDSAFAYDNDWNGALEGISFLKIPANVTSIGDNAFYYSLVKEVLFDSSSNNLVLGVNCFANEAAEDISIYTTGWGTSSVFTQSIVGDRTGKICAFFTYTLHDGGVYARSDSYDYQTYGNYLKIFPYDSTGDIDVSIEDEYSDTPEYSDINTVHLFSRYGSINFSGFDDRDALTQVILETDVYDSSYGTISVQGFNNCSHLRRVSCLPAGDGMGQGPVYIYGFHDCISLNEVILAQSTWLEYGNFYGCRGLSSFSLNSEGVYLTIGSRGEVLSKSGSQLIRCPPAHTSYTIPNTVTRIEESAFAGCAVTQLTIPSTVDNIYRGAFAGCELTSVQLNASITVIPDACFMGCANLVSLTGSAIENITTIRQSAFQGCASLVSVNFPALTDLFTSAFKDCTHLASFTAPLITSLGTSIFENTAMSQAGLHAPVTSIGYRCFANCNFSALSGDTIVSIGDYAFVDNTNLTTINLPALESLGTLAFYNNARLTSVNLPALTFMGQSVFTNCIALTDVSLPNITDLPSGTFDGCTSLTHYEITGTVIRDYVFRGCASLEYVTTTGNLQTIGAYVFSGCTSFKGFVASPESTVNKIPEGVVDIGNYAFQDNVEMTSVTFPRTLQEIGRGTFVGCYNLVDIMFTSSLQPTLGESCFACGKSLHPATITVSDRLGWSGGMLDDYGNEYTEFIYAAYGGESSRKFVSNLDVYGDINVHEGKIKMDGLYVPQKITSQEWIYKVYTRSMTIHHNLGEAPSSVNVYVYDGANNYTQIFADVTATVSTVTVTFRTMPTYGSKILIKALI